MLEFTEILGVQVACVNRAQLFEQIDDWVSAPSSHKGQVQTVSYVNAHCLNLAVTDQKYAALLNTFSCVYADGIGAVWAGKWLEGCTLYKMTAADWIHDFCRLAEAHDWSLYILAGEAGVAEHARRILAVQYPALRVLGARNGFFTPSEETEIVAEISRCHPDVLMVGLGVPYQEMWIDQWRHDLPVKICWAVGALFDYVAGSERRAPVWMRRLPLEWFWRLLVDPGGKWYRYLVGMPLFAFRVLKWKLSVHLK